MVGGVVPTHAQSVLGDQLEDNYRLWYMDNADHQPPSTTEGYSHIVLYDSELQQALLDLDVWVAEGVSPPASSNFEVTEDHQVLLAADAQERNGVQPVVDLTVTAGDECDETSDDVRVDVAAGTPVLFTATAQVPADGGEIVRVEWDWESSGEFPDTTDLDETSADLQICETHTYDEPGTHFAVVRVTS